MATNIYNGTISSSISIVDSSYDWHIFTKDTTYDQSSGSVFSSAGVSVGTTLDFYGTYEVDTSRLVNLTGTLDGTSVVTGISNARVTIHEGAELVSYTGTAVYTLGTYNNIVNYGLVTGSTGFQHLGGYYTLQNFGTISAVNYGIHLVNNAGTFELLNEGMITGPYRAIFGDSSGVRFNIVNRGTISAGSNDAIQLTGEAGADHYILNEGVIFAGGVALDIDADDPSGGTLFTTNSGTIYGQIDIEEMVDVFRNSGSVDGLLDLDDLNDKLFNHGTITKDVDLGTGDDVYRGSGAVLGEIQGDAGADRFYIHGEVQAIDGGDDLDVVYSSETLDDVSNVETIILRGNAQNHIDVTVTGTTAATVRGTDGDNEMTGGENNDILKGRGGEDTLTGGEGGDELWGGDEADVFVYVSSADLENLRGQSDWIMDYETGVDQLDFSVLSAVDPLVFIDTAQFSGGGVTGEIRYRIAAGDGEIQIDFDGDGNRDVLLTIDDVTSFSADDFIL